MPSPSPSGSSSVVRPALHRARNRVAAVIFVGAAALLAGCSEEVQLDFVQDNADSFMAACSSTGDDAIIQTEICQCVIDTAQVRLRFAEFAEIEAALSVDVEDGAPLPAMPPEMVEIVAECVIEIGEL